MDSLKAFFREKGLYLICLGLVLAATVTSIWAIRNVVRGVENLNNTETTQEGATWNQPDAAVNNPASDVPQSTPKPSEAPSVSSSSSGASSQSATVQGGSGGSAASSAPSASSYTAPVDGEISLAFSGDDLVYSETLGDWRTHNGVDYACKAGDAVRASAAGTVSAVYSDALWGSVVEVTDGSGNVWKYCGVSEPTVETGDKVSGGDSIGRAGSIPSESKDGVHIHLECIQGETWVDPTKALAG